MLASSCVWISSYLFQRILPKTLKKRKKSSNSFAPDGPVFTFLIKTSRDLAAYLPKSDKRIKSIDKWTKNIKRDYERELREVIQVDQLRIGNFRNKLSYYHSLLTHEPYYTENGSGYSFKDAQSVYSLALLDFTAMPSFEQAPKCHGSLENYLCAAKDQLLKPRQNEQRHALAFPESCEELRWFALPQHIQFADNSVTV